MRDLFSLLLFLKICQQIGYALYLAQLKEYRFDRVREHLNRRIPTLWQQYVHMSFFAPFSIKKLPRPTMKVLCIAAISCTISALLGFVFGVMGLIIVLAVSPAIVWIALNILLSIEIPVRYGMYYFASQKILKHKKKYGLTIIGITGSYGKSTTKHFLTHILRTTYPALETPGSVNTPLGIARVIIDKLKPEHVFFVVEMGAYTRGEIRTLARITHPDIAIITGISNQHLALFGSQDAIIDAKSELLDELSKNGIALINAQSPFPPRMIEKKSNRVYYYNVKNKLLITDELKSILTIPTFLHENLEPALILAKHYNIPHNNLLSALKTIHTPSKTMQTLNGLHGATIIDNTFNTSEQSVMAILDYIQNIHGKNIILVTTGIIELGRNESKRVHVKIGEKLAKLPITAIFTSRDCFAYVKKGAGEMEHLQLIDDPNLLIRWLSKNITSDSLVILEGKIPKPIITFLEKKTNV